MFMKKRSDFDTCKRFTGNKLPTYEPEVYGRCERYFSIKACSLHRTEKNRFNSGFFY